MDANGRVFYHGVHGGTEKGWNYEKREMTRMEEFFTTENFDGSATGAGFAFPDPMTR